MTAAPNIERDLANHLVVNGYLSPEQASELLADAARSGVPFTNRLVATQAVSQTVVAHAMAAASHLRFVPPSHLQPARQALALISAEEARELGGLPLLVEGSRLLMAFATPPNARQLERAAALAGHAILPAIAEVEPLRRALHAAYGDGLTNGSAGNGSNGHGGDGTEANGRPAGGAYPRGERVAEHIDELLETLLELGGSDLHLSAGAKPMARVHGELRPLDDFARLTPAEIERIVYHVLDADRIRDFERDLELDTAHSIPARSRFRMNVHRQRGSVGAVLRVIPFLIPELDTLGLPAVVRTLIDVPRGLVLVTGPTGSGKSTTLASMLDVINRTKPLHILSCEDPIEFLHTHQRGVVNQREIGSDTRSFADALRHALRQDPDVILVGEIRDLETIQMALTAAETGHLVFGTLHTQSASQTVERMIDVFPPAQQAQVRTMLATTLQAVITQQLVPLADGGGRAVAAEVLVATPAVRNLIREGKAFQIPTQMQAGGQYGMVTMDQSLAALVRAGRITREIALERAGDMGVLRNLLGLDRPAGLSAMSATYAYKVRDQAGRIVEGSLEAANERLVVDKLRELGYVPVSITETRTSVLKLELSLGRKKVGLKEIVVFSRQLATMVNSGLSILRALNILSEQTESPALAAIVLQMKGDIERGMSLSQAVSRHPKAFPPLYRSMVRAGEIGGVLDSVLMRLATMLEKQLELRGKVRSAMTYPTAIGGIVLLIVAAMLLFIVPMFQGMYSTLGGTLPLPTRLLIGASDLLKKFWWLIGLGTGLGVFFLRRWKATDAGRLKWDAMCLRLPVFGKLLHKTAIARFTRSLSSLLRAGVQAVEAIDMVADTAGNAVVAAALRETSVRIRKGESLATAMAKHPVLPPLVVQMIAVGEETGAIDDLLERIAEFYERDVDAMVNSLTSLIEPLLMVVMGVVVGGMVVALYMPMFQLLNLVQ